MLELHLWNERIPPIPEDGPDLAWATRTTHMLIRSYRAVASHIRQDPRLTDVLAVGGITGFLLPGSASGGDRFSEHLGFTLFPHPNPLGRFGEFWENLYSWAMMWTFNAASLRHRRLFRLRRSEMWATRDDFLRRYGAE